MLALASVSRVEFELATGSLVPTQLVLVPMLLLLPAPVVPLCVAASYGLAGLVDSIRGRRHPQRLAVLLASCWHSVPPALLIALWAAPSPAWSQTPLYLVALAAQFACDFTASAGREWIAFRISPRRLLPFFGWVYAVDALLAPVGLLAAFASATMPYAFLLTLAPAGLLALLARERRSRLRRAQRFQDAYDGAYLDARRDALTGLANRLAWEEATARAQRAYDRSATPASIVVLDVNWLKQANDSRGHAFGDEVLRRVAALVRANVREQDLVARIGGDELAVLLVDADAARCADATARLRDAFASAPPLEGFRLSVAVGSATAASGETLSNAQRRADARLYAEKRRLSGTGAGEAARNPGSSSRRAEVLR